MTDAARPGRDRRRRGRNEIAVDQDLARHPDLARSVRSTLRALAALLDQAEKAGDIEAGTRAAHELHNQLAAAGIAVPPVEHIETLDDFLRATAGPGHPENA